MPPQAQNTEKTIESFATGTQYKMTMRVFKPSGAYTTTTKYNCSTIAICLRRCITAAVFSWSLANISITAKQLSVVFVSYRVLL